jgi:hypothetical protein
VAAATKGRADRPGLPAVDDEVGQRPALEVGEARLDRPAPLLDAGLHEELVPARLQREHDAILVGLVRALDVAGRDLAPVPEHLEGPRASQAQHDRGGLVALHGGGEVGQALLVGPHHLVEQQALQRMVGAGIGTPTDLALLARHRGRQVDALLGRLDGAEAGAALVVEGADDLVVGHRALRVHHRARLVEAAGVAQRRRVEALEPEGDLGRRDVEVPPQRRERLGDLGPGVQLLG